MATDKVSVRCCIAGGGPAGIIFGLLLARAGVDVLILEKHAEFLRDFRGDWYRNGLLCIGDAAHAMSPIGGVGINLAIQDAVAAANLLAELLRRGRLASKDLRLVQHRREWPTRVTQRMQVFIQNRVISRVLKSVVKLPPPRAVRLLARFAFLRLMPARLIGIGFRPEHVRTHSAWPETDA